MDKDEPTSKALIKASISQLEAHSNCNRQWRFLKVDKLPAIEEDSRSMIFGDVLHACLERYLTADDRGYDTSGKPVNLFPELWEYRVNRFSGKREQDLTPEEQVKCKSLVNAAINEGIIIRNVGRQVELPLKVNLEVLDVDIQVSGFIDYIYPGTIEDHKTTSSMGKAKSPNQLRKNFQLMFYAWCVMNLPEFERFKPKEGVNFVIRHNYFCTKAEELRVKSVSTILTPSDIDDFYATEILPAFESMAMTYKAKSWEEVPKCKDVYKGCYAYGRTCPFISVCNGDRSITEHIKFVGQVKESLNIKSQTIQTNKTMGLFDRVSNATKGTNNNATSPVTLPAAPVTLPAAPVIPMAPLPKALSPMTTSPVASQPVGDIPPWYIEGVKVAVGAYPGFNSKGLPCTLCIARSKTLPEAQRFSPNDYDIVTLPSGQIEWSLKEEHHENPKYEGKEYGVSGKFLNTDVKVIPEKYVAPEPIVVEELEEVNDLTTEGLEDIQPTKTVAPVVQAPVAPVVQAPVAPVVQATVPALEPPKRKRTPKAETVASTVAPVVPVAQSQVATLPLNVTVPEGATVATDITLLIGCRIINEEATSLSSIAESIIKDVEAQNSNREYYTCNSFDRKDIFASLAKAYINQGKYSGIIFSTGTPTPEENILIKLLTSKANTLIVASV